MVQVAVTAGQRKIPITADLIRRTVVENRFDFRQSINSLEFYGNSRGSVDCRWPFHRVGSDWAFHPSWLALDDEISLYFAFSNFLPFFCDVSRDPRGNGESGGGLAERKIVPKTGNPKEGTVLVGGCDSHGTEWVAFSGVSSAERIDRGVSRGVSVVWECGNSGKKWKRGNVEFGE